MARDLKQANTQANKQTVNVYLTDYVKRKSRKKGGSGTPSTVAPVISVAPIIQPASTPPPPNYYRGFSNRPYPYTFDTTDSSDPDAPANDYFPRTSEERQSQNYEDRVKTAASEWSGYVAGMTPEEQAALFNEILKEKQPEPEEEVFKQTPNQPQQSEASMQGAQPEGPEASMQGAQPEGPEASMSDATSGYEIPSPPPPPQPPAPQAQPPAPQFSGSVNQTTSSSRRPNQGQNTGSDESMYSDKNDYYEDEAPPLSEQGSNLPEPSIKNEPSIKSEPSVNQETFIKSELEPSIKSDSEDESLQTSSMPTIINQGLNLISAYNAEREGLSRLPSTSRRPPTSVNLRRLRRRLLSYAQRLAAKTNNQSLLNLAFQSNRGGNYYQRLIEQITGIISPN